MRHLRTIVVAYQNGDHINDDELEALREASQSLDDLCGAFGAAFDLHRAYARKVCDDCREFQRHRAEGLKRDADRAAFADAMNSID